MMITVWTIRPADQANQSYSVEFGGESIIGNMLMTAHGCVAAEVTMARKSALSPVATTACVVIGLRILGLRRRELFTGPR